MAILPSELMPGAYYSVRVVDFIKKSHDGILTSIKAQGDNSDQQELAWEEEIKILKENLKNFKKGHLIFEYEIPRMRKRIDVVLIYSGIIFVLEFKVNKSKFEKLDAEQCMDYALDLKYFHKQSHEHYIVPILIPTDIKSENQVDYEIDDDNIDNDKIFHIVQTHSSDLNNIINQIKEKYPSERPIDPDEWMNSKYYPTPTIIEAAQVLYHKHQVRDIGTPEDSEKLESLVEKLNFIINDSMKKKQKSICFVTGIPGSGKTLAGLNLISSRRDLDDSTLSVFLSGNAALVDVLRGALISDTHERTGQRKKDVERPVKSFIQHMSDYRDDFLHDPSKPTAEEIVVFDEAQRAWDMKKLSRDLGKDHNINKSEPALILDILKHKDWATLICLIGGGQEINTGEIGLSGWFSAIRNNQEKWKVYLSKNIMNIHQMKNLTLDEHLDKLDYEFNDDLHLNTSLRSFKNKSVSKFINHLMDSADVPDIEKSKKMIAEFDDHYPIRITRDINIAKKWLKSKARGSERYGILAHHSSYRLKPYGVCLNSKLDVARWFLDRSDSIFSAYYMEEIASEFKTQGLELDWTCVCWDANLRYDAGWDYNEFYSRDWRKIKNNLDKTYLKNSYRVLLTRARQGTVIFVPNGDLDDPTRNPEYYGGIYNYLKSMGIKEIKSLA